MLNDDIIANAPPKAKGYKITDSGGLHVYVTPAGAKSFRYKYRTDGRERRLTFGLFPVVKLAEARRLRDEARRDIARDIARPIVDAETIDRMLSPDQRKDAPKRVYFVRGPGDLIKIGVTRDVPHRMKALQTQFAEPLRIIGSMPGSHGVEMTLHKLFAGDREQGEWFRPSQRLLDFIEDQIDRQGF